MTILSFTRFKNEGVGTIYSAEGRDAIYERIGASDLRWFQEALRGNSPLQDQRCICGTHLTLELIGHELWLLLDIIPLEIRPRTNLNVLMEVKLRLGQPPQMRIRLPGAAPSLMQINDNIVTKEMLDAIVGNSRIAPKPYQFHQGRAGVVDLDCGAARSTLHRITAVYGHAGTTSTQNSSCLRSAEDVLLEAAAELGRKPEDVKPYIRTIVEDNWYKTANSLELVSIDEWRYMKIPRQLSKF